MQSAAEARHSLGACLEQAEDVAHQPGGLPLQPTPQPRPADIHAGETRRQQLRLLGPRAGGEGSWEREQGQPGVQVGLGVHERAAGRGAAVRADHVLQPAQLLLGR